MPVKSLYICLLAIMAVNCQSYAEDAYRDVEVGISFPQELAGFEFRGRHVYEDPAFGYSLRYQDEELFKIDIYVYDNNLEDIRDGSSSEEVGDELNIILAMFSQFEKNGTYKHVKQLNKGTKTFGSKGADFLWAQYQYEQTPGERVLYHGERISNTYLRAKNGKFLKVRLTVKKNELDRLENDIEKFMIELAKLLSTS